MGLHFDGVVPPPFYEAAAIDQGVLEDAVENLEAIVLNREQIVDVVGGLFGHSDIACVPRRELDCFL